MFLYSESDRKDRSRDGSTHWSQCGASDNYDMCKALDKFMEIQEIYLCQKTGGKSGEIVNPRIKSGGEET